MLKREKSGLLFFFIVATDAVSCLQNSFPVPLYCEMLHDVAALSLPMLPCIGRLYPKRIYSSPSVEDSITLPIILLLLNM